MSFGLCNAATTMQRLMDAICRDLDFVFCYIDDVVIASDNHEQHEQHLRIFFDRLKKYNLVVNVNKCELGRPSITFLGHKISSNGIEPMPEKIEVVKNFKKPEKAMELWKFLAMTNFYRRFIPHEAQNQMVLNSLIDGNKKKDTRPIVWTPEAEFAFEQCKKELCNTVVLAFPDKNAELQLDVDASNTAIGAVLNQIVGDDVQPLAFYSKKLSNAQQNFSTYDSELIAAYKGVKHFKQQIEGRPCHILTSHKPLTFAFGKGLESLTPIQSRYLNFISLYTTDIRHISGDINQISSLINFDSIAEAQNDDTELQNLLKNEKSTLMWIKC